MQTCGVEDMNGGFVVDRTAAAAAAAAAVLKNAEMAERRGWQGLQDAALALRIHLFISAQLQLAA